MKTIIPIIALLLISFSLTAQTDADKMAIEQLVHTISEGWNAGNGDQIASAFAENHDFIVWNGYYFKGSSVAQNAKNHNGILSTIYKGTTHFTTIDHIRFIRPDVATIHVFSAIAHEGEGRPEHPEVLWSAVVLKEKGGWKITAFHNLDLEVFQDERTMQSAPIPPNVMYSSWYAATDK